MKTKNFAAVLCTAAVLCGCSEKPPEEYETTNVHAFTAAEQQYKSTLSYTGYSAPDELARLGFEMSGKIKDIYVKKGDEVTAGQVIACLDTEDTDIAIAGSNENISLAKSELSAADTAIQSAEIALKAEEETLNKLDIGIDAEKVTLKKLNDTYDSAIAKIQLNYDNAEKTYNDTLLLYNNGNCTRHDLDNAKLAFDTVSEELNGTVSDRDNDVSLQESKIKSMEEDYALQQIKIESCKNTLQQAKQKKQSAEISLNKADIGLEQSSRALEASRITASIDGFIAEVPMNEGEIVSAGTPVAVIRSRQEVVNVSVPVEDYESFHTGMEAVLEQNGSTYRGTVSSVALYPDEATRTYNVEVMPESDGLFALGSLVDVSFDIDTESFVSVPLSSIFNIDGIDYVYRINSGGDGGSRIEAVKIKIEKADEQNALISGIDSGTVIVSDEVKKLHDNLKVNVIGG